MEHNALVLMKAQTLQRQADTNTAVRYHLALPHAVTIAATEPNWPVTIADAALWRTDARDGQLAGQAREFCPELPRTPWSLRDPEADKRKYYGGLGGIMIRAAREGDITTAVTVGANIGVSALRDRAMARDRAVANSYGLSEDATTVNKWKTRVQAGTSVLLASPLSRNRTVRRAALVGLSAGTLLGVVGQQQYRGMLEDHIGETPE